MAAMAQQDCGQCGYNCADYANALFQKKEERLNLCAPGGKETARMLKQLAAELGAANATATPTALDRAGDFARRRRPQSLADAATTGRSALYRTPTAEWSQVRKRTRGTSNSISRSSAASTMSSATVFGIFPPTIIRPCRSDHRHARGRIRAEVGGKTLREVLRDDVSLGAAPDALFELISYVTGGTTREKARALARGENPDGDAAALDVMAALQKFPGARSRPRGLR